MSHAVQSRLVSEISTRASGLSADELNALTEAKSRLTGLAYKNADVVALIAAAAAVVTAKAGASVLTDMNASITALGTAAAITTSAGAE